MLQQILQQQLQQQLLLMKIEQQQQQLQQGNGTANAGNNAHDMKESQQDNVLNEDDASHVTST